MYLTVCLCVMCYVLSCYQVYYMQFEVLDPLWHAFERALGRCKSVDDVLREHALFQRKLLMRCLLSPSIFRRALLKLRLRAFRDPRLRGLV